MNKAQLVEAIADKAGGKKNAAIAVNAVFDAMVRAVVDGDTVSITGFGSIRPFDRPARLARNPQTGGSVRVPTTRVPAFRAGARFKALVAGARVLPESGNCIQKAAKTPRR